MRSRLVLCSILALSAACTDAGTGPAAEGVALALHPVFATAYAQQEGLPIHRIRLTARDAASAVVLLTRVVDVNPADAAWQVELVIPATGTGLRVVVAVELINVQAGIETVEWSGQLGPISITAGATPAAQTVTVFPGPLDNLTITRITLHDVPDELLEGDVAQLRATVDAAAGAVVRVQWSTSDASIATVDQGGSVTALLPGTARIIAQAGPQTAQADIVVRARPVTVVIDPAASLLEHIGAAVTFTAAVLDVRGDPVAGAIAWSVDDQSVLAHDGAGTFSAVANGTATVTAALAGQPTIAATAAVEVRQRAVSLVVEPSGLMLTARDQTAQLTAHVFDAGGSELGDVALEWSSSNADVASVSVTGVVTAHADGSTTITVGHAELTASADVVVRRAPAALEMVAGNDQTARVATALPVSPAVRVVDAAGAPVAGVTVVFNVTRGGGSAEHTSAVTDEAGIAVAGSWTLGAAVGTNVLLASVGGLTNITFTATATAAEPAIMLALSPTSQEGPVGSAVAAPAVRVTDAFGNPVGGVTVSFAVVAGGGSVGATTALTAEDGTANAGAWTLGTVPGAQRVEASATGITNVGFDAVAHAAAPAVLIVEAGADQSAPAGTDVPVAPAVRVTDAFGNPLADVSVHFAVTAGGGTVQPMVVPTNEAGTAQLSAWTLGEEPGANAITVTVDGLDAVIMHATGLSPVDPCAPMPVAVGVRASAAFTMDGCIIGGLPAVHLSLDLAADAILNMLKSPAAPFTFEFSRNGVVMEAGANPGESEQLGARTLPAGLYVLRLMPQTAADLGAFEFEVLAGEPASCGPIGAVPGIRVHTSLSATDCTDAGGALMDSYVMQLVAGTTLHWRAIADIPVLIGTVVGGNFAAFSNSAASTQHLTLTVPQTGLYTIVLRAADAGLAGNYEWLTELAEPAASITIHEGDGQSAIEGQPVTVPPAVIVRDAGGAPIAGWHVSFAIGAGEGTLSTSGALTDADGIARVGWTLGPAGPQSVVASLGSGPSVTFLATASPIDNTLHWTNPSGGSWHEPTNWSTGAVPGADDDVAIDLAGTYTVDIGAAAAARNIVIGASGAPVLRVASSLALGESIEVNGGRLDVLSGSIVGADGAAIFNTAGIIHLSNAVLGAHVLNLAIIEVLYGTSSAFGMTNGATGLIELTGNNGHAVLDLAGTLHNSGLIELHGTSWGGVLDAADAVIVNATGGTITSLTGTSHNLIGPLINEGTITIDRPTTAQAQGVTLQAHAGTISIASGQTFNVNGGTGSVFDLGPGGTLLGPGTLMLSGSVEVVLSEDFEMTAAGPVWTLPGTVDFTGGGTLTNRSVLTLTNDRVHLPVINEGTLIMAFGHTGEFLQPLTNGTAGLITLDGTNGPGTLRAHAGVTNAGSIELRGSSWGGIIDATGSTITNQAGGIIHAVTGVSHELRGTITNHGTLTVDRPTTAQVQGSALHALDGTVSIASAQTFTVHGGTGGTLELAPAVTMLGPGTISLTGSVEVALPTDFEMTTAGPLWTMPGTVDFTGAGTLTNRNVLTLTNDRVHLPVINEGTLIMAAGHTGEFLQPLTNGTAGLIRLDGTNGPGTLRAHAGVTNAGSIELRGSSWGGIIDATGSTITNQAGGIIHAVTGVSHELRGTITNHGTLTVDRPTTAQVQGSALHALGGTVSIATAQTFTVHGGTSGTLELAPAVTMLGPGTISLTGSVEVALPTDFEMTTAGPVWTMPGTVDFTGAGTLTNRNVLTLTNDRVHLPVINEGTLIMAVGQTGEFLQPLTNGTAGLIRLDGTNGPGTLRAHAGVTNAGSIELRGSSWGGIIDATGSTITNQAGGVIHAVTGVSHELRGTITNRGTLTVDRPTTAQVQGSALHALEGTVSIASAQTFTVHGGTAGTLELAPAVTLLGPGTISLTGTVEVALPTDFEMTAPGPVWTMPGTVDFTGAGTLTNRNVLTLTNDRVHLPVINEGTLIMALGHTGEFLQPLTNGTAGLIRLDGTNGPGTLRAHAGMTNAGSIELRGSSWGGIIDATGSTITNQAGGVIHAVTGVSHELRGTITNQGTLTVDRPTTAHVQGVAMHALDGTVSIASAQTFTVHGGTAGTLELAPAVTMLGPGTISLTGTVEVVLPTDFEMTTAGPVWTMPGTVDFTGAGTLTNRNVLTLTNDRVHLPVINEGTLIMAAGHTGEFLQPLTNGTAGLIRLDGTNGPGTLRAHAGVTNTGAIEMRGSSWGGIINATGAAITNQAGGVIHTVTGVSHELRGTITNHGTVTVDRPTTAHVQGVALDALDGTVSIASAQTFTVHGGTGGTLELGPAVTLLGPGTLSLAGTVEVALPTDFEMTVAGPVWTMPGTVDFTGAGTLTNRNTLTFTNDRVHLPVINEGTLIMAGSQTGEFLQPLTNGTAGLITLDGNNGPGTLRAHAGMTNDGSIELRGSSWGGNINVTGGPLVSSLNASIHALGSADVHVIEAHLQNAGILIIDRGVTLRTAAVTHANTGAVKIGAGRTLTVSSGDLHNAAGGVITGLGTLNVAAVNFSNDGVLRPGDGGAGTLTIAGNVATGATAALEIDIYGFTAGLHDVLVVTGSYARNGALALNHESLAVTEPLPTIDIVTATSASGAFLSATGLGLTPPHEFSVGETATGVQLTVIAAGEQLAALQTMRPPPISSSPR